VKMNIKALALSVGSIWAASVLFVGLAHVVWPSYGGTFLDLAASIYPGFHPSNSLGAVIVGTLYAFVDGGVGGAIFAWLYNKLGAAA
jgi:hypothetical protein